MSETMSAITIEGGKGPAEALKLVQVPRPTPKPGEVLIRVHAAGMNRADIAQRQGNYPPPPGASEILGLEVAGEIVEAAGRWKAGDRVCALLGGGGYAQYVACDARHVLPLPPGMDFVQGAALAETVITVYANLFEHAGFKSGETFMVHGGTSGIGTTAIQMAKRAGGKVIATSRGADKAAAAKRFGADVVVDTRTEDFAEVAKAQGGVDVILEMVGGDEYFSKDLDSLKTGGRIAFIAAPAGGDLALPIWSVIRKRAVVTGSTIRARSLDEKARLIGEVERAAWPWVVAGDVKPVVDRTFPLAEAAKAHADMEEGRYVGKIILTVG